MKSKGCFLTWPCNELLVYELTTQFTLFSDGQSQIFELVGYVQQKCINK